MHGRTNADPGSVGRECYICDVTVRRGVCDLRHSRVETTVTNGFKYM